MLLSVLRHGPEHIPQFLEKLYKGVCVYALNYSNAHKFLYSQFLGILVP